MTRLIPLFIVASLAASLFACNAEDEMRTGGVGEYCNGRDSDCRAGLVCLQGVCDSLGPRPTYDCDDICERLGECGALGEACASDCRLTTADWSFAARDEFGICLVEDLTCGEAVADFAPQTCYTRIEIPSERLARCSAFDDTAADCGASLRDREELIETCYALARTSVDDAWRPAEDCADLADCAATRACLTSAFGTTVRF